MSCVRKRGKSWNAQVRVSGWRSFTKSFNKKTDAITWSSKLEHQLRNTSLPEENIQNLKLSYLMKRYAEEVSSKIKSGTTEQCQLRLISKRWIGGCKVINLNKSHFEQYRDDRLKEVKSGTVKAELTLIQRVFKTAIKKWGYGLLVNPIANIPGAGVILFGDKTKLARPSAFDRINVRRLFLVLERAIARAAEQVLFEFNDEFTRAEFVNIVEPVLREVKGRRGITDFRVVADETNNTPAVIDRNEFVASIFIKPAISINFVTLNFVAVRTGVDFEEVVGTV